MKCIDFYNLEFRCGSKILNRVHRLINQNDFSFSQVVDFLLLYVVGTNTGSLLKIFTFSVSNDLVKKIDRVFFFFLFKIKIALI